MQEKLVIYLHTHDLSHPSWAVINADNTLRQSAYRDNSEGLAQISEDKEIIVIVPAEDVLLMKAELPKMSKTKLYQALPFAVEEQLVSDVDTLHFAASDQEADGRLSVAIVSQDKMQMWLSQLQAMHIKPDKLIPETFALPMEHHVWHVFINEMATVRISDFQGFASDKNNFSELMDIALQSSDTPKLLHIHNYTKEAYVSNLTLPVEIKEDFFSHDKFIADLARYAIQTPYINLLQGRYAVKKAKFPQMNKLWQVTAYLAAAWIGLLFLYPLVSYLILSHRMNNIDNQIAQIYKRHFPQSTSIVAPKLRMQEKLQKLDATISENRLLLLMGYIGKGMHATPSIKLKRMEFQNNQLTLDLMAANSDDFSAFTDYLTQQGLNVKQQNANLSDSHINATIVIE